MASAEIPVPTTDIPTSARPSPPTQVGPSAQSQQVSSMPIELESLSASGNTEQQHTSLFGPPSKQLASAQQHDNDDSVTAAGDGNQHGGSQTTPEFLNHDPAFSGSADKASPAVQPLAPHLTKVETAPAIGPATDKPTLIVKEATEGPVLFITLLLASTGARHPYKLDGKYLMKRSVEVEDNNPVNMSLYKLKELILRDWRSEWDAKPSSPESIRLIFMGKMLNDKSRLADNGFTNGISPQIVHMAIKPQEIVDEEEANKAVGKDKGGNERSPGCRCVLQ